MTDTIRVLLIEDDDDDRLLIEETLEDIPGTDYDLVWASTADHGVELLLQGNIDVCLLDYRLGASTGLEVLERSRPALDDIPCILLTGNDNAETDRRAMDAGAIDYLVKGSFSDEDLERAIRYAIANSRAGRALRASEQRFRSVFEAAHDGIAVFDDLGRVDCANPAACQMFEFDPADFHGIHLSELLADTEIDAVESRLRQWDEGAVIRMNGIETVGRRSSGATFPLELSIASFEHDGRRCWSALLRDTSTTTALLDQLAHQTLHDSLTGLANRALLRERIDRSLQLLRHVDVTGALMIIDIDNFKHVNDLYGHTVGDHVLAAIAQRLRESLRAGETIARVGSDEFAVLTEGRLDPHAIVRLAERLRVLLNVPLEVDGLGFELTGSIGLAIIDNPELTADELIRNADVAMYSAKALGKNRIELFEQRMFGDLIEVIALDQDLRIAVESGEITAHYQPIVNLVTGDVHSFEALARWHHPDRGWVRPDLFIGSAERSGMIDTLGLVVLSEALDLAMSLPAPIRVAVNVSSHQFRRQVFSSKVLSMLRDRGLAGDRLTIEVTESLLLNDVDGAIASLERLREAGVRVALDDFGTGFSSLSYLQRLPIDELKLDRSFVQSFESRRTRALIEAVATIAQTFEVPCVAEGIERDEELAFMRAAGFELGQGFLIARPMARADVAPWLVEREGREVAHV